jgi:hypothetical protein
MFVYQDNILNTHGKKITFKQMDVIYQFVDLNKLTNLIKIDFEI